MLLQYINLGEAWGQGPPLTQEIRLKEQSYPKLCSTMGLMLHVNKYQYCIFSAYFQPLVWDCMSIFSHVLNVGSCLRKFDAFYYFQNFLILSIIIIQNSSYGACWPHSLLLYEKQPNSTLQRSASIIITRRNAKFSMESDRPLVHKKQLNAVFKNTA